MANRSKSCRVEIQPNQNVKGAYVVRDMETHEFHELPRRFKFTDARIRDLPLEGMTGKQRVHWDDEIRCFGLVVGLAAKSFIVQKDLEGKGARRITIGKFDPWICDRARQEARRLLVEMDNGVDPRERRDAEVANAKVRRITLKEALESHLGRGLKPSTKAAYAATMECIFNGWMEKPIVEITRDKVLALYDEKRRTAPIHADASMRILRAVINSASKVNRLPDGRRLIAENPVQIISDSRAWAKCKPRDRVLSDEELPKFFKGLDAVRRDDAIPSAGVGTDYLEFILFTGLRRTEAATLDWANVDLNAKSIRIPDTKNKRPHILPITDHVVRILEGRRREK